MEILKHDPETRKTPVVVLSVTDDRERAERFLTRAEVGTVYWNCSDRTTARLPWAGRRHSGLGVSLGEAGIHAFLREKAWHSRPPTS